MTSPARRRSLPRFARKSILSPIRGLSHIPLGAGRSELEEGLRQISRGTVARWRRSACHLGGGDPLPGVSQVWEHGERLGSQTRRWQSLASLSRGTRPLVAAPASPRTIVRYPRCSRIGRLT